MSAANTTVDVGQEAATTDTVIDNNNAAAEHGEGRGRGRGRGRCRARGRGRGGAVHVDLPSPLKTRASNKTAPSLAEPKQARRTADEMERARATKAAQEAAEAEQQQAAVQKVADLEDSMHREDSSRKLERFSGPPAIQRGQSLARNRVLVLRTTQAHGRVARQS